MCSSYCLHCGKNRAESRFPQMQSTLISTGASDDTWPSFAMQCWHTIYQSNGTSWQPLIAASVACNLQTTRIRVTQTEGEEDTCVVNFSCFAYVLIIFWILSLWDFSFLGKDFSEFFENHSSAHNNVRNVVKTALIYSRRVLLHPTTT